MTDFDFEGSFGGAPTEYVSKSIRYGQGNVVVAKLSLNTTALYPDSSAFIFYLSNNGGTSWEEVTLNTNHTFTSTGGDLRFKIRGSGGAELRIRQTDGTDYCPVIKVI